MEDPELFVCPTYNCPVNTRGAGVAPPQGTFGQPGNATFEIMPEDAGQEFVIFCPINGHCLGSMYQKVISSCPPPPGVCGDGRRGMLKSACGDGRRGVVKRARGDGRRGEVKTARGDGRRGVVNTARGDGHRGVVKTACSGRLCPHTCLAH
eukprot:365423-Chlamydomonas_euryale.AAC.1